MTLALTQLGFEDLDIDWPVVSSIGDRVPGFGQRLQLGTRVWPLPGLGYEDFGLDWVGVRGFGM